MIIQIRGTSGSGKSHVVRAVMKKLPDLRPVYVPKRKKPLYYCNEEVVVLGHYESPCGGCDTIGSAAAVYDLALQFPERKVLCEGLLLSEDVKWSIQLRDLRVLFLLTPLKLCLSRINYRRREAGNPEPVDEYNTENRVKTIERARLRLKETGVECYRVLDSLAPGIILKWLKGE